MTRRMVPAICLLGVLLVFGMGWSIPGVLATDPALGRLGSVDFPTSGSPEAQIHFLRGVAAMHSFWYEEALDEFRAATGIQPDFAMGYWGEAMTYNHPVWREQDTEAGRAALQKINASGTLTSRERAYLDAIRVLYYGEGDKAARDEQYAHAMAQLYRAYPEDLEAACFYALSLLGTVPHVDTGFRRRIQAGAIALDVFDKNPNHPCAAHYAIHAFDHPDLAILALPAARRYAEIAPASHHAQHMPAHIFLQLGMWPEATRSNEKGWTDSVAWVTRQNLPLYHRDYHSLHWLLYVRLQQGQYRRAGEVLALKQKDMLAASKEVTAKSPPPGWEVHRFYSDMLAEWVIETEKWDSPEPLGEVPGASVEGAAKARLLFLRGMSAAMQRRPDAETQLEALRALRKPNSDPRGKNDGKLYDIWALELSAAIASSKREYEKAIQTMKQAVALEETLPPPSGPPAVLKPSHELLGEILLQAGRPKEAGQQFALALQRHPRRTRSLLGAARAAVQLKDQKTAAEHYAILQEIYKDADEELAEVREARAFR